MHARATGAIAAPGRKHGSGGWLRLQGCAASDDGLLPGIIALAGRIEPDLHAVWEWFHETPIHPHGKTAMQLVRAGQGRVVMAFLQRVLVDSGRVESASQKPSAAGAAY